MLPHDHMLYYVVVADLATSTKIRSSKLATALAVLHSDVFWSGMVAQKTYPKKVFPTFLQCIFYLKTK